MEENEIYAVENAQQNREQNNKQQKPDKCGKFFYGGLVTGLVMSLLIVGGVYLAGYVRTLVTAKHYTQTEQTTSQDEKEEEGTTEQTAAVNAQTLEKMQIIESVIDTYFYQEDVDKEAMTEGIYKGMVESLGDPYSEYYSAEELLEIYQDSQGIYYGIGAVVSLDSDTGLTKVAGIIADSPAEDADLREEDLIYKVDDEEVYGLSLQKVVSLIKGDDGTTVRLTLIRDGVEIEKDLVRRKVEATTVNYEMYDNGIAYIQITEFDTVTEDQFAEALAMAKESGMKGLILDLRSNPGGNLSSVVNIARMILPKGMIVYTEDRDGNRQEYTCDGSQRGRKRSSGDAA